MSDGSPAPPTAPRGEIFDLGYRNYDGDRLGRAYALRSLIVLSLRNTFGIGRSALPKVLAFGLAALALIPAFVTVLAGALSDGAFEFVDHADYFGLIQIVIVLFVAAMSSDLVGNDRKNNTLVLYFSRPIARDDYVFAKLAALAIALLSLTLIPQLIVFIGNWLGATDSTAWFGDNAHLLWRIVVSSTLVSIHMATIGLAIAMFSKRRAFALISVLGVLLVSSIATSILVSFVSSTWAAIALLLSPLSVMEAVNRVVFDALLPFVPTSGEGDISEQLAFADLPGWAWIAALLTQSTLAVLLAVRRYRSEV
ncbi:MAG: ABC transporter permease subunit [Acidimicrobiales bacterium]